MRNFSGKNKRRKLIKQAQTNTINEKLTAIQQNYENKLQEVTKLHDDVKIMTIERKDKAKLKNQFSKLKSINLKLATKINM